MSPRLAARNSPIADRLLRRLHQLPWRNRVRWLHHGQGGKWYPGEQLPRRWALGCFFRRDGVAVWQDPKPHRRKNPAPPLSHWGGGRTASSKRRICRCLSLKTNRPDALWPYEDAYYYLWRSSGASPNVYTSATASRRSDRTGSNRARLPTGPGQCRRATRCRSGTRGAGSRALGFLRGTAVPGPGRFVDGPAFTAGFNALDGARRTLIVEPPRDPFAERGPLPQAVLTLPPTATEVRPAVRRPAKRPGFPNEPSHARRSEPEAAAIRVRDGRQGEPRCASSRATASCTCSCHRCLSSRLISWSLVRSHRGPPRASSTARANRRLCSRRN